MKNVLHQPMIRTITPSRAIVFPLEGEPASQCGAADNSDDTATHDQIEH